MRCPNVEVAERVYLPPRSGIRPPTHKETLMRFYTSPRQSYAGIDLHARSMQVCVLGGDGMVVYDRNRKPPLRSPRENVGTRNDQDSCTFTAHLLKTKSS